MKTLVLATAIYAVAAFAAIAESDHRKGTAGLTRLDYSVANGGQTAMSCDVKLAHWYSDHLATVPAGETAGFTLWSDAQNGAVYRVNAAGDRMPVEQLWCGLDGKSWETRAEIALPRLGGQTAAAAALRCEATAGQTRCDAR